MRILKWAPLILPLVLAFGCAPAQRRHLEAEPGIKTRPMPLVTADTLDKKIALLQDKLREGDLAAGDKEALSYLLDTYQSLESASVDELTDNEYRKIIRRLIHCLSLVEKNYFLKKEEKPRDYLRAMEHFSGKRRKIMNSYLSGKYRDVINGCLELKSLFGPDAFTPEIGLVLALSLAKEGRLEEAINIGEGITQELRTAPDLTLLKTKIAEWKLRLGQQEDALSMYEGLADELGQKERDIQSLHREILAARSPVTPRPDMTEAQEIPAEAQEERLLRKVDRLIQEQKFDKARELLSFRRSELLLEAASAEEVRKIDRALAGLTVAEEEYLQEKISMLSRDSKKRMALDSARRFLEEEKFEDAISRLESLDPEQKETPEVKELKALAIERLINRERNRAARIFLAAKKATDPEKKAEYLLSSYKILKILVDRYPSSPLILKVKSHIKVVREELDRLGKTPS